MSESPGAGSTTKLGAVLVAAAAVVVWRVIALLLLPAGPGETSRAIPALLAVAGVTYLACGLLVLLKLPGKASLLFAGFCICSGLHWGGPLELAAGKPRTGFILFYLLVSGILAAILLLHLALTFPRESRAAGRRALVGLLYLPVGLAALLMAISLLSPSPSDLESATQQGFLLLHTVVSNLFSLLALILFASHIVRKGTNATQKRYVGLMVAGMLAAWLPYLVASAVGVTETDPWNLTVVALPVSFAIAFFRIRATGDPGPAV